MPIFLAKLTAKISDVQYTNTDVKTPDNLSLRNEMSSLQSSIRTRISSTASSRSPFKSFLSSARSLFQSPSSTSTGNIIFQLCVQ